MTAIYLGQGDGNTAGALDLLTDAYRITDLNWALPPIVPGATEVVIQRPLLFRGASAATLASNIAAVQTMLSLARHLREQRSPEWVTLSVQLGALTEYQYADVRWGTLEIVREQPTQLWTMAVLTLICRPAFRTDTVTVAVSGAITQAAGTPATPGNAGVGALYVADVVGDEPAPARLRIIDGSGGSKVINRLRIGVLSRPSMSATALKAWLDQTSVSPGADTTTETNRIGSNYAALTTSDAWQTAASFTGGSSAAINAGVYDVFARMWSNAGTLRRPTGVTLGSKNTSGSLAADSYLAKITSLDTSGNETDASDVVAFTISTAADRQPLSWTVNGSGATDHRVYVKKGSAAWVYVATGSASGSYNLDSIAGASTGDPPSTSDFGEPYARLAAGDSSLNVLETLPGVQLQTGSSPSMVYLGREQLPPVPWGEGESGEQWAAYVQGITGISGSAPTLNVDALVLLPPWPQVTAEYTELDLGTQREWWIETRRDGRTFCTLRSKSDQSVQGWAACVGELYLPPGDCLIVVIADIAGGLHDATNTSLTMQVDYVPQWRVFRGSD